MVMMRKGVNEKRSLEGRGRGRKSEGVLKMVTIGGSKHWEFETTTQNKNKCMKIDKLSSYSFVKISVL